MEKLILQNKLTAAQGEALKGTFLTEQHYDRVITENCDGYNCQGALLFKFRKGVIPFATLQAGYMAFKDSIELTEGRGVASGSSHKRIRKDGSTSNITVGNKVYSGNVGYMDPSAMVHYCRKTAFARDHFDKFQQGVPFVKAVDALYAQLCPEHYAKQIGVANQTNINYRIADTSFTTVTVNRNFQTAVHKDAGDYPHGFGNLCVYREGVYEGAYFCLPEYRVAIDMQNCDMLFVDVHRWHGNSPFVNCEPDFMRVAFVMYYREFMMNCKQPADELKAIKDKETGYYTL